MERNSGSLDRDEFRANLLKYTRKAYDMLPKMEKPRILDLGCGSGVSTLELARISGGDITAVDIDRAALNKLAVKAKSEGLSARVTIVKSSMIDLNFAAGSFDVIWSEGSISFIGFERGLKEWRDFVTPDGSLVIHDVMTDLPKKLELVRSCGYDLLGKFELPPNIWRDEYYAPLKKRIETLKGAGSLDDSAIQEMKAAEKEIRDFDLENDQFGSVFFVLRQ